MKKNIKCPKCKLNDKQISKNGKIGIYCKECYVIYKKEYFSRPGIREKAIGYYNKCVYKNNQLLFNFRDLKENKCEICGEKENKKKLCIDHNHETGELRGILCSKCNSALGLFKDNIENLKKAIEYLETKGSYCKHKINEHIK